MRSSTFILFLLLSVTPVFAIIAADCPEIVRTALAATDQLCEGASRNDACYGHDLLEAQPQPGIDSFVFNQPGQTVDVASLRSLRLFSMDIENDVWGVALMRLQADLPSTQPEDVTLLVFGDVEMRNAVEPTTQLDVTVAASRNINVRAMPSSTGGVIGTLAPRQTTSALERLADNSWLRVQMPGNEDLTGWISTPLVTTSEDLETLNVGQASEPHFRPMQAFYFQSSGDEPACEDIPANGLLIQTPEGMGKVRLWINEVKFQIGSTVFIEAQAGDSMTVRTLEGAAQVEAMGVTQIAVAGTQLQIPIDANLKPVASPSFPVPYEAAQVENLPVEYLDEQIEIHPPLTQAEINQLTNPENGSDGICPDCDTPSQIDNCPGNSCNAPGHGGECPGQSCNAPGQGGDCPGNSCNAPGQNKDKDKGKN